MLAFSSGSEVAVVILRNTPSRHSRNTYSVIQRRLGSYAYSLHALTSILLRPSLGAVKHDFFPIRTMQKKVNSSQSLPHFLFGVRHASVHSIFRASYPHPSPLLVSDMGNSTYVIHLKRTCQLGGTRKEKKKRQ
ncbi:hypothetical protein, variant [Blastomyces dermatitidis ATCC 18188]|uniref:Uncharacterized protein n=1 Tax=Ajellomyces dermatitidis (strain ATCC 18188 / CBS 674.68) TaxID=653446 RepID=A0A0J9HFJ9_AJEDA|nr:hypothetical protein BDFG_03268 [Blastomyces dermatitidis ATCC 26199]KMW67848.1 hypothetical protein BDDG_12379 [Blastomyces dermatitidis ATCC 18188]KMW67849.1 hypothetical protein, variant [Blastomyces dermatitidis ATCC 18188]